jgi:hypothetical protein
MDKTLDELFEEYWFNTVELDIPLDTWDDIVYGIKRVFIENRLMGRKEVLDFTINLIHQMQNGLPYDEYNEGKMSGLTLLECDLIQELEKVENESKKRRTN